MEDHSRSLGISVSSTLRVKTSLPLFAVWSLVTSATVQLTVRPSATIWICSPALGARPPLRGRGKTHKIKSGHPSFQNRAVGVKPGQRPNFGRGDWCQLDSERYHQNAAECLAAATDVQQADYPDLHIALGRSWIECARRCIAPWPLPHSFARLVFGLGAQLRGR